jgi:hypothetical protein
MARVGKAMSMVLALVLCGHANSSHAQSGIEHITAPAPEGFRDLGKDTRADGAITQIWRVLGQTDQGWTDQLVVRTLPHKAEGADLTAAMHAIAKGVASACKGTASAPHLLPGKSNGYSTSTMMIRCSQGPDNGDPETAMFHAIKGTENFYMVIRSAHYEATMDQVKQWIRYMGSVHVCDDRTPDHRCRKPL